MKKIKVLQIGGNAQINGITTFLLDYYRNINRKFEFVFINCAKRNSNEIIKNDIFSLGGKIYHIPYTAAHYADYQVYLEELRKVIRIEKPLAIQSNYFSTNGLYLKLAFEEGIPLRIACCMNDKSKYLSPADQLKLERSRELIEKYATAKLAISKEAGLFMYGNSAFDILHPLINKDKFYPITNKSELCGKYGITGDFKYTLFVGRFSFQKNIYFLIDIAEKCDSGRKFLMVGQGEEKENFLKRIDENNLKDRFLFFETYDTTELYNIADSFALPSLYEGLGIVLLEAQLSGLPCLVSDCVPKEANIGLCKFLALDSNIWVKELNEIEQFPKQEINLQDYCNKRNVEKFIGLYKDNNVLSEHYISQAKEYMLGSNRVLNDWNMAFKYFKMAHELGNIKGTFYYALQFFEGHGTEKNVKIAQKLMAKITGKIEQEAIRNNKAGYLVILADMYSFGLGKEQSFTAAFELYLKSANLGNLEAMCDLGYMYLVGQGTEKNLEKSFYWYKKSADSGYLHSIRDAGQSYFYGLGTKIDYKKAIEYFERASRQNYSHATSDLAVCYLQGNGVTQDWNKAAELFLLAIKQERDRAIRDIIAHGIDVDELLQNKTIKFISRKRIDVIDSNVLLGNTIIVNKDIEYIDPKIFYCYKNINKFFVEKDNPVYYASAGVLYSKDKKTLIRFPVGSAITEFEISSFVQFIGNHAFQNCRNLKKIALHNDIQRIGNSAFDDCKNLAAINIPESVTEIDDWAFHGCDKIKEFYLPKKLTKIGKYAFGSCEKLKKIVVDEDNDFFRSINGNLYSKDLKQILQYAIGKKAKLFSLPKDTETIAFRAFSDAYYLRLVDAGNIQNIEEKAFYYCTNLKAVLINKACNLNGKEIFGHTAKKFAVTQNENGKTILVSDIHGHLRLDFLRAELSKYDLRKNDVIIILGDAGIVWSNPMNETVRDFYASLPCTILFLDGNHENFDLLDQLKYTTLYGARVHKVLKNVYHLLRGNVYLINGYKYFVFGGAYSIKRDNNSSPIQVWDREMPEETEYRNGMKTLTENEWSVDFILTHQAPKSILNNIDYEYSKNEINLLDYLEGIKDKTQFARWYFGHIHRDLVIDKFTSLYEKTEVLE